jgi:hypothetical protein
VAAAAAAQNPGIELLIADRTFCSLAGAADALLGKGAGVALRAVTGWGGR